MAAAVVVACCCGLPAAGKTSVCRRLAARYPEHTSHVCFDDFIEEKLAISAGPEFDPERWRQGRSAAMAHLEALVKEFIGDKAPSDRDCEQSASADQSNMGVAHVILVDDNMHYRRMRHDVLQLARRRGCAFAVIYLPMDAAIAEQCNASRDKPVPGGVISRMAHALEPPDPEHVPWERYCATVTDSVDDGQVDAVWRVLQAAARDPPPPAPAPALSKPGSTAQHQSTAAAALATHGSDAQQASAADDAHAATVSDSVAQAVDVALRREVAQLVARAGALDDAEGGLSKGGCCAGGRGGLRAAVGGACAAARKATIRWG